MRKSTGRLVTGKGDYANRSIFLPAAGYGYDSDHRYLGLSGDVWTSSPLPDGSYYAWLLRFDSSDFIRGSDHYRFRGQSVRPVREFAK